MGTSRPRRLVGRAREWERLTDLLTGTAAGHPAVVLISGESGIGKTWLADVASTLLLTDGWHVLWGRGLRFLATSAPYLPLVTALETWLEEHPDLESAATVAAAAPALRLLVPDLARSAGPAAAPDEADASVRTGQARLLLAWERALAALAAEAPTLLVVDDVQWADATSLDELGYLAASLPGHRLALVVIYRDSELPDGAPLHTWLADLRRMAHTHEIRLGRLAEPETRAQIEQVTGADPEPALVAAIQQRSGGNPYLTELLALEAAPDADRAAVAVPDALRAALLASWHQLDPATRGLCRVLAVAGRPTTSGLLADVADACGMTCPDPPAQLRLAVAAGVLTVEPDGRIWFRHPLLAEVLYASLLPEEQQRLHAAFADAYTALPDRHDGPSADLARHCARADRTDEAFEHYLHAAEHARSIQAYREHAAWLTAAADLWPQVSDPVRARHGPECDLLLTAAHAARWASDEPTALTLAARARAAVEPATDPLRAARALTEWAEIGYTLGTLDLPARRQATPIELTAGFPDSPEHARALASLAEADSWLGDSAAAREHADLAVAAGYRSGDLAVTSYALYVRTLARFGESGVAEDAEACQRLAARSGQPDASAFACIAAANAHEEAGDLPRCAEVMLEGYAAAAAVGIGRLANHLAVGSGHVLLLLGDLDRVDQLVREVLATRPVGIAAAQVHTVAATLALRRGSLDVAGRHLDAARAVFPDLELEPGIRGAGPVAEHLLAGGRPTEALRMLERAVPGAAAPDPWYGDMLLVWAARAAAELGQAEGATAALDRVLAARRSVGEPFAKAAGDPSDRALQARYQAECGRLGEAPDQAARWRAARTAADRAGCGWLALEAHWRHAEALCGAGARVDAAIELRAAHRAAVAMGAGGLLAEMATLARLARIDLSDPGELGVTDSSDGVSRADPLAGLTVREREVLAHLLAGRSYAEIARALFISQKTVGVHVSHLLRKTGTANRTAAAVWARRHGIVPFDEPSPAAGSAP